MAIDGSIGMRVPQHILQGLECERVASTIISTPGFECSCWIIYIELCENRFFSLAGSKGARPVTQLTLYPKGVRATASMVVGDYPPIWNSQGGESECIVILPDVRTEFLRNGILVCKQSSDRSWWGIEGRELDTARITAGPK